MNDRSHFDPDKHILFPNQYHILQELAKDLDLLFVTTVVERPGVEAFMQELEFTYFPPLTPENDNFNIYLVRWPDDDGRWFSVCVLPISYLNKLSTIADKHGLVLLHKFPVLIKMHDKIWVVGNAEHPLPDYALAFPINSSNVYSLENVKGHPIYTPDIEKQQTVLEQDRKQTEKQFRQLYGKLHIEKN